MLCDDDHYHKISEKSTETFALEEADCFYIHYCFRFVNGNFLSRFH